MHSYLRSIGFSNIKDRRQMDDLIKEICLNCDARDAVRLENGRAFIEYRKEFLPGCGIIVCGEMDMDGFHQDYYFPYYRTNTISSDADLTIEKHAGKDSFGGVCEDTRMGTSMIFYVQNAAEYQKNCIVNITAGKEINTTFTGLSTGGCILLPVYKKPEQVLMEKEASIQRNQRIVAARNGDEEAIESLTLEDMDTYSMISRRILHEDVLTIVDTFFMPFGMECDHYQVMGEILDVHKVRNTRTKEYVYQMKLLCNEMEMDICINEADLKGDPDVGRRFKGDMWLQGFINF